MTNENDLINECCEGKQKIPDCVTSQHSKHETLNKEIEDIMKRIDCMVRGNMKKDPKKPPWVEKQKVVFKYGISKFVIWLQKKYLEEEHKKINPNIVKLRRDYRDDKKGWRYDSIGIKNPEDWEEIKKIIDIDFASDLGWITKEEAVKEIKKEPTKKKITEVLEKRPSLVFDFLDGTKISEMDRKKIVKLNKIMYEKNQEIFGTYIKIFEKLLKIKKRDEKYLNEFDSIVNDISIYGITSTLNHVTYRLGKIEIFEKKIMDETTYERKGKESIHRFLEDNIWIFGEDYQVLQSDKPLRKLIGNHFSKRDKKYSNIRPDFACSTFGKKLVIIEIKRPKYNMKIGDINQVELYRNVAEHYSSDNFDNPECYLIVSSIPRDLRRTVKDRDKQGIHVMTYRDVVKDVKIRYKRLREVLKEDIDKIIKRIE